MKFKYYHANSRLNTTDESSDKSKDFHIEFIEALNNLNIKSGNREFILNPLDIIISKMFLLKVKKTVLPCVGSVSISNILTP